MDAGGSHSGPQAWLQSRHFSHWAISPTLQPFNSISYIATHSLTTSYNGALEGTACFVADILYPRTMLRSISSPHSQLLMVSKPAMGCSSASSQHSGASEEPQPWSFLLRCLESLIALLGRLGSQGLAWAPLLCGWADLLPGWSPPQDIRPQIAFRVYLGS